MFGQAIIKLGGKPIKQTGLHKFLGQFSNKYLPADYLFMGSVSVELVTDVYGNCARRSPAVYPVMKKMFDLHNIEEARHILFTKSLLKTYAAKAGYIKRTLYSYVILFNILFVRTMYVKKEIFERIGLENRDQVFKLAAKNFKQKFSEKCLDDIIEFVDSWKGFNNATRWAWRWVLGCEGFRYNSLLVISTEIRCSYRFNGLGFFRERNDHARKAPWVSIRLSSSPGIIEMAQTIFV